MDVREQIVLHQPTVFLCWEDSQRPKEGAWFSENYFPFEIQADRVLVNNAEGHYVGYFRLSEIVAVY